MGCVGLFRQMQLHTQCSRIHNDNKFEHRFACLSNDSILAIINHPPIQIDIIRKRLVLSN